MLRTITVVKALVNMDGSLGKAMNCLNKINDNDHVTDKLEKDLTKLTDALRNWLK